IGACIQNMLLVAHENGLGAVWIGEILNRAGEVNAILGAGEMLELMAVVTIGHPAPGKRTSSREPISKVTFRENLNTPYE
ncbi:MAG: nitroreductase family protein, partial [Methanosarcinales archaeon]|nr:nitroreductase family protein [Methanosarcinales archaeon]